MTSPRWKSPCTSRTPMGSRLLPSLRSFITAPASTRTAPRICRWSTIHCLRACNLAVDGRSAVPMASPAASRSSTSGSRPQAMIVPAPLPAARLAARILVNMPPRPMLEPAPPAMRSSSGSPACALSMKRACGCLRGSAEYRPRWSVRITSTSASTRLATKAPSVSLSPNLISSLTTVSFSLMTGSTRWAIKVSSVERALR
mmetsp:Transcript_53734/g.126550  ORF Transcript_53734/g.126550 Transcript_53734/m.126550 type:complete len:201 (-) Transcript_53734:620-1222(-)